MYSHFSKSLQESKSALTMRPVSVESTLLLFLLIRGEGEGRAGGCFFEIETP